ncbi:hypothetical protein G3H63_07685 [Microbacterium resistens]|uniref:hypothetical protein n=1 Tax=Microbacterium resistens TaxID=156977 RepID=UPI000833CC5D|nr:hypothetical protein [Microbacterium resistens]MBW1638959.1 hypothetical protein [Microbacterium resistens]
MSVASRPRRLRGAGAVLLALGLVLGVAAPALAATTTEVVQGRYLRLESTADWEAASRLSAGDALRWDVRISADAPDPGRIVVGLVATGGVGLTVDARLCLHDWQGEVCPGGETVLLRDVEVRRDGVRVPLGEFDADAVGAVRLDVSLAPSADASAAAASTELRVRADGFGEGAGIGPPSDLPPTGADVPVAVIVVGAVLLVGGALAVVLGAVRRGRRDRDADASADGGDGEGKR